MQRARNSVLLTHTDRAIYDILQMRKREKAFCEMEIAEIALMINRVSYFLGLREPLEKGVLKLQAEFLQLNFATETPSSFRHAFELAAAQQLDVQSDFFGVWTPQYMGRILNAYKQKRGVIEVRVRQQEERVYNERDVQVRSEMFDIKVALSKMIFDAHENWQIIHSQEKVNYGWLYLWQLKNIAEILQEHTFLKPENIIRRNYRSNSQEDTIELFTCIFNDANPDGKKNLSQDFWQKWLNDFYAEKKQQTTN